MLERTDVSQSPDTPSLLRYSSFPCTAIRVSTWTKRYMPEVVGGYAFSSRDSSPRIIGGMRPPQSSSGSDSCTGLG